MPEWDPIFEVEGNGAGVVDGSKLFVEADRGFVFLRLVENMDVFLRPTVPVLSLMQEAVHLKFYLLIHLFLFNHVHMFLLLFYLENLFLQCLRVVSFRTRKRRGIEWRKRPHQNVVVQVVHIFLKCRLSQMVKVLDEYVLFFLHHLIISAVRGLMPQINVSEIGEIDVHFADVLKELSSIKFIFCLQFIKTYVDCVLCLGEFYKKFCHFPFLKNQDLRY